MASNDLFAPPTQEEIGDPMFAPPSKEERYVSDPPQQEPDMSGMKSHFEENLKKPREAQGFIEVLEAGWDMSVSGLLKGKPDVVLPEDAGMAASIASGVAQIAGDLPAIIPGFIAGAAAGGVAGSAVPVVGNIAGGIMGAGAGANALPAAIRTALMQHYEKGDIKDFGDFYERSSAVLLETLKQGTIGAVSGGAGMAVGKVAAPVIGQTAARLAGTTSEIATMTTVGAALEGEAPSLEDFTAAGLMVATIHGLTKVGVGGSKHVSQKMRKIYAETGIKPEQIVEDAKTNPILQQELLMDSPDLPSTYKELAEPVATTAKEPTMSEVLNEPVQEIKPDHIAVRTILDGVQDAPASPKEKYSLQKAYTEFVDKLNPINQAVKILAEDPKSLPADKNPYSLARMANDSKAKVRHVVERGTIDFKTLEVNGKGLKEIVAPFKDNLREFEAFLISKRATNYESRGLNAGFDMNAAREVIKMGEGKYGKAAKELVEFQRRNLQYIRDAGLISKSAYDSMVKAGDDYIPLKRIMEPEPFQTVRGKGGALKRVKGVVEGADIKTASPMLSILENTETFMRLAEKNRAVEAFVRQAEESGAEGVIQKVKSEARPIEVTDKEVANFFKEHGIEADAESFNIFRPNKIQLAENEFEVFREGKREVYKADKDLAEAFKRLDGDINSTGVLMKLARGITTFKRMAITLTPEFVTRNFLRDQMMSAATSKGGVIPFTDVLVAMGDIFKKNENYYNYLKSGGAQGAFLEINDRYLMKDVFKLEKSTGMLESTWNVVKTAKDAAFAAAHIIELAPRLAEFKKVSEGAKSGSKVFEGGFAAREVTLDFQRIGAKMSAWNAITAFTNATIQGADKAARALRDDPAGVAMKGAAYITAPSILLWWLNKDDERYKAIPRWEKDMYWHIITDSWEDASQEDHADMMPEHLTRVVGDKLQINKGVVYRLPKPHEFGVLFGSLPERILEGYVKDNPRAFKGFDETILNILSPGVVPDAAAPVAEQWANKSIFTGRQMIPFGLEKVAPEFQYTDYTSETAKQLSKMTSYLVGPDRTTSPIVIDNYVRQWAGAWGQYALQYSDAALAKSGIGNQNKPASALSDVPAVKAFVTRYPGSGAQQISDFYDREKEIEQKIATVKLLGKKAGMEDDLERYIEDNSGESMARIGQTAKALSNSRKIIQNINADPEIPPKEKRQLIDGQYYYMIEAAKAAMEIADQIDKNMEQVQKSMAENKQE